MEIPRELFHRVAIAGEPEEPVAERAVVTASDPVALRALLLCEEAKIDPCRCVIPRIDEGYVIRPPSVGEHARPREGAALEACALWRCKQPLEPTMHNLADDLAGHADVAAFAVPLLASGRLELVALFLGVAQQVAPAQLFERLGDGSHVIA